MLRNLVVLLFVCVLAGSLHAALINYNPAPTTDTGWNGCTSFPGYLCRTTANFDANSLQTQNDSVSINSLFQQAFEAWCGWNGTTCGNGWTLNNGGDLTGTFDVTVATAQQFGPVVSGGLTITITPGTVTLPTPGAGQYLVWSQGLYDNYLLDGSIVTPFYEMDVTGGACANGTYSTSDNAYNGGTWCAPAYPFQYQSNQFYDQPKASYKAPGSTQAFFDANAYVSILDPTAKTLTVYDGVSYGFQNYVSPEPGAWVLLASGLALLMVLRRKRLAA